MNAWLARLTKVAWRNVWRNWRHSLATTMAIASGFMAICLFDGFIRELEFRNIDGFSTRGMLGHIIIERRGASRQSAEDQWKYNLDEEDQAFIVDYLQRHEEEVAHRVRWLTVSGMIASGSSNRIFFGLAHDVEAGARARGERWRWNVVNGKPLYLVDEPSVLLGSGLGQLLGCESTTDSPFRDDDGYFIAKERPFACRNDNVTLQATTEFAQINTVTLPVAGFIDAGFREADKRNLQLPLEVGQRLLDTNKISMVSLALKSEDAIRPFIARMQQSAKAAGRDLDIMPWQEHSIAAYVMGGLQILYVFRNLFMSIVAIIGILSIANTLHKSVNERIREIGTMRSLGFRGSHLVYVFGLEGALLAVVACGLGAGLTLIAGAVIKSLGFTYRAGILSLPLPLEVAFVPSSWLMTAAGLTLLATGTAVYCAKRATRLNIAEALRFS